MKTASELMELAELKLDEAIRDLQTCRVKLSMAHINIQEVKERLQGIGNAHQ